ncbi:oxidoreductase [Capronia epimyces CBS 606.96]|uniref:Oxidoreductase n=1 Tax=Capronia epimyces CBS 606.96 TaxID=1182542 RepID=W9XB92_9EURO|nr:oxidoreductase [Capronia epimyces CBS 606.96]EXJ77478.1 oxidoreductase [Capronia epimyces CBS 606.96]
MTTGDLKNVVVVGGSYVGRATAKELAQALPSTHRVLLVEPHSHFHHLFTFPRFAIVPGQEHKAFVPYSGLFSSLPNAANHAVVQARVLSVHARHVNLDREWQGSKQLPFEYLALATGTSLAEPAGMKQDEKPPAVRYLQTHQEAVKRATSILIAGGGAVGVQMATDLKEYFPDKAVTLVQSRARVMPQFHPALHELISKRFDELGIDLITGTRIVVPPTGFPNDGTPFQVQLTNGSTVPTELVILATGQRPNNGLVAGLEPSHPGSLINPENGFVRVRPTLQLLDLKYPHIFAVGDIADTGVQKAARPGIAQAAVLAKNVKALADGQEPTETYVRNPAAIHLTLGMQYNVIFRNPNEAEGQTQPTIVEKQDGREDMGVEGFWERQGIQVINPQQYHL